MPPSPGSTAGLPGGSPMSGGARLVGRSHLGQGPPFLPLVVDPAREVAKNGPRRDHPPLRKRCARHGHPPAATRSETRMWATSRCAATHGSKTRFRWRSQATAAPPEKVSEPGLHGRRRGSRLRELRTVPIRARVRAGDEAEARGSARGTRNPCKGLTRPRRPGCRPSRDTRSPAPPGLGPLSSS
jgi:hypothetical protein